MSDQSPITPPAKPASTIGRTFGWLLLVLGGLWTVLTGGCTGVFLLASLTSRSEGAIPFELVLGAVCMSPGAVCLLIAWLLLRRPPRRPKPDVASFD